MYMFRDECCILETATAKQPFHPRLLYSNKGDVFCPPNSRRNSLQNENDVLLERSSISLRIASKVSPLNNIHFHSRETHTRRFCARDIRRFSLVMSEMIRYGLVEYVI